MIGYIRRQKDDNNKILRPLGFESQNHIAIKKPPQGRFFLWASAAGLEPHCPRFRKPVLYPDELR